MAKGIIGCIDSPENIKLFNKWSLDNGFANNSMALRWLMEYARNHVTRITVTQDDNRR